MIVINWNAFEDTCRCLEVISAWKHIHPQVFVVDNNSSDNNSNRILSRFADINFILNPINSGFSGGNNIVFKKIIGCNQKKIDSEPFKFILLLNNDAFITEHNFLILRDSLLSDPTVGVIGPLLFSEDDNETLLNAGGLDIALNSKTYWNGPLAEKYISQETVPYAVNYVSGTVALLRSGIVSTVGLFDEDYFFSGEMADFCERIKKKGFLCSIHPRARAYHNVHCAGNRRNSLYIYYSLRNRFLFIRKFRREKKYRLFGYWIVIGGRGILKNLLLGRIVTARAIALALYHGVLGRFGERNDLFIQ